MNVLEAWYGRGENAKTSRTVLSNPALHKKRQNLEKRNVKIHHAFLAL